MDNNTITISQWEILTMQQGRKKSKMQSVSGNYKGPVLWNSAEIQ